MVEGWGGTLGISNSIERRDGVKGEEKRGVWRGGGRFSHALRQMRQNTFTTVGLGARQIHRHSVLCYSVFGCCAGRF